MEYYTNLKKTYITLKQNKQFKLLDAKKYFLSGATAIIYNKNSIKKVLNLIQKNRFKTFYDLLLREFIQTYQLKASIIFPFPIGLNLKHATKSQLATQKDILLKYNYLIRDKFFIKNNLNKLDKYYIKFIKHYIKNISKNK